VAFPSFWVSCYMVFKLPLAETRLLLSIVSVCLYFVSCLRSCCPGSSRHAQQFVSAPLRLDSFGVLNCLSLCARQEVSAPQLLGFFPCPDLSLPLDLTVSESPFPSISFGVLTRNLPLPLRSTGSERPLPPLFIFVSKLVLFSTLGSL
jgi:hypothetical protein